MKICSGVKYNGNTYIYRKDIQGNICAILDSNGSIIVQYKYDAWGNHAVLDANGADITEATHIGNINPFRYRGYYYDTETGLYYLKSRYYDPETGRFISIDDISYLDPETINGLNLYSYCGNNPVMNVDPEGMFWGLFFLIVGISALLIGTGVAIYAGVTAYNNGYRGWDLAGAIARGFLAGAAAGALVGALIAMFIYAAPAIGSFLSSTFTLGYMVTATGAVAAITVTGAQIAAAGAAAAIGLGILFAQWVPGSWPGDDPTVPPGDGFEWRGPGEVGSEFGEWYNPATHDQLHPNLNHPLPKGPHWGWRNKWRNILIDIFKNIGGGSIG